MGTPEESDCVMTLARSLVVAALSLAMASAGVFAKDAANPKKRTARGVAIEPTKELACAKAIADERAQLKGACSYYGGIKLAFPEECKSHIHNARENNYFAEKQTIYYCNAPR